MLGSLLKQFLTVISVAQVPKDIHDTLDRIKNEGGGIQVKDVIEMLKVIMPHFDRVFVCIDALDE